MRARENFQAAWHLTAISAAGKAGEGAARIKCPQCRFYRLDVVRDELSPQVAERFDRLALFDRLRREGASQATALKAVG